MNIDHIIPEGAIGRIGTALFCLLIAYNISLLFIEHWLSKRNTIILNIFGIVLATILTLIDQHQQDKINQKLTQKISTMEKNSAEIERRKFKQMRLNITFNFEQNERTIALPDKEIHGIIIFTNNNSPVWKYNSESYRIAAGGSASIHANMLWENMENKDIQDVFSKINKIEIQIPIAATTKYGISNFKVELIINDIYRFDLKNAYPGRTLNYIINSTTYEGMTYDLHFEPNLDSYLESTGQYKLLRGT